MATDNNELIEAVGTDVGEMDRTAMGMAGIRLTEPPIVEGRAWRTHQTFSQSHPEKEEWDRRYARYKAFVFVENLCLGIRCPRCGRSEGRRCEVGKAKEALRSGPTHRERREEARERGMISLRGLRLSRCFPCDGMLRAQERRGKITFVQCDGCGAEMGIVPDE